MKTFETIFVSANEVMTETRAARKAWRMKYNTLTRLLHDTQTKDAWKITESVYAAIGLPLTRKVSRTEVEGMVKVWHTDSKGNRFPAYISRVTDKNEDGTPMLNEDGTPKTHYETRPVKEGAWTLDKLAKVLACSNNATEGKKK